MAFEKHIVDRLSTRLPSLLPDWIQEEAPVFELFVKSYFEYLESEIIVLESQTALEGVRLEDGTSLEAKSLLLEDGTNPASPQETSKIFAPANVYTNANFLTYAASSLPAPQIILKQSPEFNISVNSLYLVFMKSYL